MELTPNHCLLAVTIASKYTGGAFVNLVCLGTEKWVGEEVEFKRRSKRIPTACH